MISYLLLRLMKSLSKAILPTMYFLLEFFFNIPNLEKSIMSVLATKEALDFTAATVADYLSSHSEKL